MKLTKVLSLMVALCMLFTMTSFAVDFTDVDATATYAESVRVLTALKILNGYEDGTFKPEGKITRAEFSKVIACALAMGDTAQANATGGIFTDVNADHWASGFIATAYQATIINGMGDGTFAPEAEVTYEQAVKMIVAALGYNPKAESLGGYPTGYMMVANQEGVTVGTNNAPGGAARATVARLVYNSLTVPMMDQSSFGKDVDFAKDPKLSLLYSKLDVIKTEAKVAEVPIDKTERKVTLSYTSIDPVARANGYYNNVAGYTRIVTDIEALATTVTRGDVNLNGLQGLTVTALLDMSDDSDVKLLAVIPKSGRNEELIIKPNLLSKANDAGYLEYYKAITDDKPTRNAKIKLDTLGNPDLNVYKNLEAKTKADYASLVVGYSAQTPKTTTAYKFVDTDNDAIYDTVFVIAHEAFVVGSVTGNKIFKDMNITNSDSTFTKATLSLDPEDEKVAWSLKDSTGKDITVADIQKGDVASVAVSTDNTNYFYDITISNEKVSGIVSEVSTENNRITNQPEYFYNIGGKDYQVYSQLEDTLKPGDEVSAIVAANGKIIAFEVSEATRNYALVTSTSVTSDFGETAQLQLLKADGTIAVLNLYEKYNSASVKHTYPTGATNVDNLFAPGTLVCYELNSKNEIKNIRNVGDTIPVLDGAGQPTSTMQDAIKAIDKNLIAKEDIGEFKFNSEKIGSYNFTEKSIVFTTETDKLGVEKNNVMLSSMSSLEDEHVYNYAVIANDSKDILAIVLYKAANSVRWDSYPMMITKVASVTIDGNSRTKYTGYVNGDLKDITVSEDKDEYTYFKAKDAILFSLNGAGELVAAVKLATVATVSSNDYYMVATNNKASNITPPVGVSPFPAPNSDNKGLDVPVTAYGLKLTDTRDAQNKAREAAILLNPTSSPAPVSNLGLVINGGNVANDLGLTVIDIPATSAPTAIPAVTHKALKGYGFTGKAHQLKGKSLQLLEGTGFDSVVDTNADRTYGAIEDFTISSNTIAYVYDGETKNIRVSTISELETEKNTGDEGTSEYDNDDLVYVYNYDGDTYFILIVDAHGDND